MANATHLWSGAVTCTGKGAMTCTDSKTQNLGRILHCVSKSNLSVPRKIVDFPNPRGIIIHKFSPESPTNPRQIQNLHYNICYRNFIFGCLGFAGQPVYWRVKLYLGVKKIDLFSANLLTSKFPTVQSLNTTQHNTTQHNTTQHNTTQHNTTQHNT